ncbi:hypothetical protein SK128_009073 [Halocaridina rubra]|uniref:Uncharacterized protein n=1 Tax=Halocaridina rubra TaxID=373956 RepID=A0AAN8XN62_HALRR
MGDCGWKESGREQMGNIFFEKKAEYISIECKGVSEEEWEEVKPSATQRASSIVETMKDRYDKYH